MVYTENAKEVIKKRAALRAALFVLFIIKFIFLSEKIVIFAVIKFE